MIFSKNDFKALAAALLVSSGGVSADGTLIYLGETIDETALWLSVLDGTDSGEYGLEAANNKWREEWDQPGRHPLSDRKAKSRV